MISVTVRAIMKLAEVLGGREQTMTLPDGSRVGDLLRAMEEKYGRPFAEIVYEPGGTGLSSEIQIMVNGRNVAFQNGLDTHLLNGDDVFFLVPISGG